MEHFKVLNVKCEGCANNIKKGLAELSPQAEVTVNIAAGEVIVEGQGLDRTQLSKKLTDLGYPEAG